MRNIDPLCNTAMNVAQMVTDAAFPCEKHCIRQRGDAAQAWYGAAACLRS